jgi:hypothetical protein
MKKGQITAFIILGILLLLIIGTLLFLNISTRRGDFLTAESDVISNIPESNQIKLMIDNCLQKTASKGLIELGKNGGYLEIPSILQYQDTGKWYVDQVNVQPSLDEIKLRLEQYINSEFKNCLDYSSFIKRGINVVDEPANSSVIFGGDKVVIDLNYFISVGNNKYTKEFRDFKTELGAPFRRMFETASLIINLQMTTDFKRFLPLEKVNSSFRIDYSNPEKDYLVYKINHEGYSLIFSSKFGENILTKNLQMQRNSNIVPTVMPRLINSLDNKAQLIVGPDTTFHLDQDYVDYIGVTQRYLNTVTSKDVPVYLVSDAENSSLRRVDHQWNLSYPVYQFSPNGLRFSEQQVLKLYWDEDQTPRKGELGILYYDDEWGWRAIPSKADYKNNHLTAYIPGFSEYTVADCEEQATKKKTIVAKIKGGDPGCAGKLAALVIALAIAIVLTVIGVGAALAGITMGAYVGALLGGTVLVAPAAVGTGGLIPAVIPAFMNTVITTVTAAAPTVAIIPSIATVATLGSVWGAATAGALTLGMVLNGAIATEVGEDYITVNPLCDQYIKIKKISQGGKGQCFICRAGDCTLAKSRNKVYAGENVKIKAKVPQCDFGRAMACQSCSVTCEVSGKFAGESIDDEEQLEDELVETILEEEISEDEDEEPG